MIKALNFIAGIDKELKYLSIDTKNSISTKMELLLMTAELIKYVCDKSFALSLPADAYRWKSVSL